MSKEAVDFSLLVQMEQTRAIYNQWVNGWVLTCHLSEAAASPLAPLCTNRLMRPTARSPLGFLSGSRRRPPQAPHSPARPGQPSHYNTHKTHAAWSSRGDRAVRAAKRGFHLVGKSEGRRGRCVWEFNCWVKTPPLCTLHAPTDRPTDRAATGGGASRRLRTRGTRSLAHVKPIANQWRK